MIARHEKAGKISHGTKRCAVECLFSSTGNLHLLHCMILGTAGTDIQNKMADRCFLVA